MVRPIFLPDRGQRWSYGDLDQHEFRLFAHYANPKDIIEAYATNPDLDMHQIVADLTGMPRSATRAGEANAKQINLGMVFNMGAGSPKGGGLLSFVNTLSEIRRGEYAIAADMMLASKWAAQVGRRAVRLATMMRTGMDYTE